MRVIPVIDLMGGKVVHAVGGEREKYKPIESLLTKSTDPIPVAVAFKKLGLEELYIADLDAICSTGRNPHLIEQIASKSGMKLMVDAGFRRADEVRDYVEKGVVKIVLATETFESLNEVSKVIVEHGVEVVASVDVKFGQIIAESKTMRLPPKELVRKFESEGVSEILLLSLDRVGTARGPDLATLKEVLDCATVPVLVGGGIRDMRDIRYLQEQGVSGLLVATAIHRGTITKEELDNLQQRR